MSAPGKYVRKLQAPPPRGSQTDTGQSFMVDFAERGPVGPVLSTSITEFEAARGGRVAYSYLYDAAETFFREGGVRLWTARAVGPARAAASFTLRDAANADTLTVRATSVGDWANGYTIEVEAGGGGGTFVLVLADPAGREIARSPDLVDKAAAFTWAASSLDRDFELVDAASRDDPAVVAARPLAGGGDDHLNARDPHFEAAQATFVDELGVGQISWPGRTSPGAHTAILSHAARLNRVALLDLPDTATSGTLTAAALAQRGLIDADGQPIAQWGGAFAPWAQIPPLLPGAPPRTVPYSAVQAGIIARNDGAAISPNDPAAGELGKARFAIGLSQAPWDEATRGVLNEAGVNVARVMGGEVTTFGYRTLADPADPNWLLLSNSRLYMLIAALAGQIADRYTHRRIDGQRITFTDLRNELGGMLVPFWTDGSLYGDTPEEAFNVDTGETVNTPASIQALNTRALIGLQMSPFGERVYIDIAKVRNGEAVA